MSKKQNNFNVLIQVQTQNEAERIISIFRGAAIATRAHRVTSESDLLDSLKNDQWHLLVIDNRHPEVSTSFSLDALKKHSPITPVLLLTEDSSAETQEKAFKVGMRDVINAKNDKHFAFAARREMESARKQFESALLENELNELKAHADNLLSNSDDAIAYVADGIIIKSNDAFAEAFGYKSDQLDCASMIDLVDEADHNKFKNFFKLFAKGDLEKAELNFKALNHDKQAFDVFMTLSNSSIDGEACTQVTIARSAQSTTGGAGNLDVATDLYNRYYLLEQLATTALQANNGGLTASLVLFSLDNFNALQGDIYLSGTDHIIKDLAQVVRSQWPEHELISRLGDDIIAVIAHQKPDIALKKASELLPVIEKHICEYNDRTLQYTCTASVMLLNNKNSPELLDQAIEGIYQARAKQAKNTAILHTPSAKAAPVANNNDASTIEEAIEHGLFQLLYQPLMSLQGDAVENYEVSVWMEEKGKKVSPDAMIQSAKNSKLDRWIILESTKALSMHRASGHNTRLILNLTKNALLDEGLAAWLKVATKAANLTPDLLIFQFDEDDIRNNLKAAIKTIATLREGKFSVSSKNFGKDAEPFKLLGHITLDMVRFDTSFTTLVSKGDTAGLKDLISRAKELSIKTLLPEVDNAGALATLWQLGTHYIQGSYLQNPSPVMNFEFTELG